MALTAHEPPSSAEAGGPSAERELESRLERLAAGGAGREELLDLRGARLAKRVLAGLDLSLADLSGADLGGADLSRARLFRAKLAGAVLVEAVLDDADLTGADLAGAHLERASARRAGLGHANLRGAKAFGASFELAVLAKSACADADFRGAEFTRARMQEADLSGAHLERARLDGAELNGCRVDGASFNGCDLRHAELRRIAGYERASWIGADLRDVDFTGSYMARRFILDQNFIEEFKSRGRLARAVHWVWWATSDCGRSLTRWGLFTITWALAFTGFYTLVEIDYGAYETWFSPFYFTIVTATTLGYGDVVPASTGAQVLAALQVSSGYVMLGGLLSILSNKLARRAE